MPQSLTACVRREAIKLALVPSRFADNTIVGYVKTLANAAAMRTSSSGSRSGSGGKSTHRCHVSIPAAEWMVYKDTRDVGEEDDDDDDEAGGGNRGGDRSPLAVVEVKGPNGLEVIHSPLVRPLIYHLILLLLILLIFTPSSDAPLNASLDLHLQHHHLPMQSKFLLHLVPCCINGQMYLPLAEERLVQAIAMALAEAYNM